MRPKNINFVSSGLVNKTGCAGHYPVGNGVVAEWLMAGSSGGEEGMMQKMIRCGWRVTLILQLLAVKWTLVAGTVER